MDRKLLSDYWDINCDKYEVNRNCKENKLVAMEENDFIDLQGKIMDRFWSFEEDFKIMICAFFVSLIKKVICELFYDYYSMMILPTLLMYWIDQWMKLI